MIRWNSSSESVDELANFGGGKRIPFNEQTRNVRTFFDDPYEIVIVAQEYAIVLVSDSGNRLVRASRLDDTVTDTAHVVASMAQLILDASIDVFVE
jgi:hypothetical protein